MSKVNVEEIVIDGTTYVPKNSRKEAEKLDGMDYVIIRGDRSGVFAGYLESKKGKLKLDIDDHKEFYEKVYNLEVE
jgi:hypothetical protein